MPEESLENIKEWGSGDFDTHVDEESSGGDMPTDGSSSYTQPKKEELSYLKRILDEQYRRLLNLDEEFEIKMSDLFDKESGHRINYEIFEVFVTVSGNDHHPNDIDHVFTNMMETLYEYKKSNETTLDSVSNYSSSFASLFEPYIESFKKYESVQTSDIKIVEFLERDGKKYKRTHLLGHKDAPCYEDIINLVTDHMNSIIKLLEVFDLDNSILKKFKSLYEGKEKLKIKAKNIVSHLTKNCKDAFKEEKRKKKMSKKPTSRINTTIDKIEGPSEIENITLSVRFGDDNENITSPPINHVGPSPISDEQLTTTPSPDKEEIGPKDTESIYSTLEPTLEDEDLGSGYLSHREQEMESLDGKSSDADQDGTPTEMSSEPELTEMDNSSYGVTDETTQTASVTSVWSTEEYGHIRNSSSLNIGGDYNDTTFRIGNETSGNKDESMWASSLIGILLGVIGLICLLVLGKVAYGKHKRKERKIQQDLEAEEFELL